MSSCQESVDVMGVFEPLDSSGNVVKRYPRRFLNESGTTVENGRLVLEVPAQVDPVSFYDSSIGFKLQIAKNRTEDRPWTPARLSWWLLSISLGCL